MKTDEVEFNYSAMLERLHSDTELAEDLLSMFVELRETLIGPIQQASAEGNVEAIGESAHRILGSLKEIHAERAIELAKRTESAARSGDLTAAISLSSQLIAQANAVADAVDCHLLDKRIG